jgi:hypothetical protein
MTQSIDVSDLPEPIVEAIESMVRAYRLELVSKSQKREVGWAREVLPELPLSFFEPLPEELTKLFEGKV